MIWLGTGESGPDGADIGDIPANGDYKPNIYFFAGKNITNIFFVIFLESISGARGDDHLEAATATLEESRSYRDLKLGRIK